MNHFKRLGIKLLKFISNDYREVISKENRYVCIITNKLMRDRSNELLMHPKFPNFYIKSIGGDIYVKFDYGNNKIKIVNHRYSYDIELCNRITKLLYNNFIKELELKRLELELKYSRNIDNSLRNVLGHLNNKINENKDN